MWGFPLQQSWVNILPSSYRVILHFKSIPLSVKTNKGRKGWKCRRYWLSSASLCLWCFSPLWIWNSQDQYFSISYRMEIGWLHCHRWASCKTMGSSLSHLVNYKIFGLILPLRNQHGEDWGEAVCLYELCGQPAWHLSKETFEIQYCSARTQFNL